LTIRRLVRIPAATIGLTVLAVLLLLAGLGPAVAPFSPYAQHLDQKLQPPSTAHWLGTDEFGRDILSRLIVGSRFSLSVGLISVAVGMVGGLILGGPAGFYRGNLDNGLMTLCDILLAFPGVLLALAIVAVLGPGLLNAMLAVGLSSVPIFARLIRAQFLALSESVMVESARAVGASNARIMLAHLLPNSLGPVLVQAFLRIASAILMAATLSFLGLGAQPPEPEWGAMLSAARTFVLVAPHLAIAPGVAITLAVIAINLVGDTLRDVLDPRLQTE
jgi:ABC-type dipeptide/oligopeptide/nickel transport system permease subunit